MALACMSFTAEGPVKPVVMPPLFWGYALGQSLLWEARRAVKACLSIADTACILDLT